MLKCPRCGSENIIIFEDYSRATLLTVMAVGSCECRDCKCSFDVQAEGDVTAEYEYFIIYDSEEEEEE